MLEATKLLPMRGCLTRLVELIVEMGMQIVQNSDCAGWQKEIKHGFELSECAELMNSKVNSLRGEPLFFAADLGPQITLDLVAKRFFTTVTDQLPPSCDLHGALVIGTSTSESGCEREFYAREWARQLKIPIVAIEDYAGNCALGTRGEHGRITDPDFIIAESGFSRRCYVRAGFPADRIIVLPPIRYDAYRAKPAIPFRHRDRLRGVLWAGQPERGLGQATLGWLVPWIRRRGLKLYFRAHPRDSAYAEGFWHEWLRQRRLRWMDCTQWDWPEVWGAPLGLVATAFSSVAVDAAFRGLPTLHVVHPRPVRKLLMQQKGIVRPGVVVSGAALASTGPLGYSQLEHALSATSLRRMEAGFERVYRGSEPVIDVFERVLKDIISTLQDFPAPR